mmetsp:Transcript_6607/g.14958  ORF Transcript_6607/g.14958 Transcript_6607/m.14958 type:complete len:207 (-) Transcript_6607:1229-1849(-)
MLAKTLAVGFISLCLQPNSAVAFSFNVQPSTLKHEMQTLPRRSFLETTAAVLVATIPTKSNAVVFDSSVKQGTLQPLTEEEAEQRFRAGRESVDYLLKHYDEICEGGGDNMRGYLGTVGTASGLFGIRKAMKALAERADDIVEYTELSREIEQTIEQADGSAYMAIFTSTSTSYTPPEKYFKDAKIEVERCAKSMDELGAMIGIKF